MIARNDEIVTRTYVPASAMGRISRGLVFSFFIHLLVISSLFFARAHVSSTVEAPFYINLVSFYERPSGNSFQKENGRVREQKNSSRIMNPAPLEPVLTEQARPEAKPAAKENNFINSEPVEVTEIGFRETVYSGVDAGSLSSGRGKGISSPTADTSQPIETKFGNLEAPSFIYRAIPEYPLLARRLGKEAKVVLSLLIDQRGDLKEIEVLQGADYGFTEAAVTAVKKSTFSPAKRNGQAVSARALLVIRFQLD